MGKRSIELNSSDDNKGEEREFVIRWFHTGKYEASYRVRARNQEEAEIYLAEHRLELEPEEVFPLCDDYEQFL